LVVQHLGRAGNWKRDDDLARRHRVDLVAIELIPDLGRDLGDGTPRRRFPIDCDLSGQVLPEEVGHHNVSVLGEERVRVDPCQLVERALETITQVVVQSPPGTQHAKNSRAGVGANSCSSDDPSLT